MKKQQLVFTTPQAQVTKNKKDKLDFNKIKNFYPSKTPSKKKNDKPQNKSYMQIIYLIWDLYPYYIRNF